jgi:hypothetical protein
MIQPIVRKVIVILIFIGYTFISQAQPPRQTSDVKEIEKPAKPYRILTSGKQVTIKSTKEIKSLMVWTAGGNRIVEEKNINASQYNFRVTIREKIFFIMLRLVDGKTYSEKIGVQ